MRSDCQFDLVETLQVKSFILSSFYPFPFVPVALGAGKASYFLECGDSSPLFVESRQSPLLVKRRGLVPNAAAQQKRQ